MPKPGVYASICYEVDRIPELYVWKKEESRVQMFVFWHKYTL